MKKISKILAANRSEIAIRIFRAAEESGIKTAAIYSKEDRFAIHRFKTDESYLVGEGKGPIQAYLDIDSIIKGFEQRIYQVVKHQRKYTCHGRKE